MECTLASQKDYSSRPVMLLITPYDLDGTSWTKEAPTFTVLARLMHMSKKALAIAEDSLLSDGSIENLKVSYIKTNCNYYMLKRSYQFNN